MRGDRLDSKPQDGRKAENSELEESQDPPEKSETRGREGRQVARV